MLIKLLLIYRPKGATKPFHQLYLANSGQSTEQLRLVKVIPGAIEIPILSVSYKTGQIIDHDAMRNQDDTMKHYYRRAEELAIAEKILRMGAYNQLGELPGLRLLLLETTVFETIREYRDVINTLTDTLRDKKSRHQLADLLQKHIQGANIANALVPIVTVVGKMDQPEASLEALISLVQLADRFIDPAAFLATICSNAEALVAVAEEKKQPAKK
ncbi:MAG: hypothetical protein V1763_01415 [Parcubacteria group bacterium]